MLKYTALVFYSIICFSSTAQIGWNWPDDPETNKLAQEKQAYYKVQMHLDEYPGAWSTLTWLYQNTPDLNSSIYIDGAKVLDVLLEADPGTARKQALQDSLLWTFDMRIRHFDEKIPATDRKAYTAFKLYYKEPAKYAELLTLYQELFSFDATGISDFNLTPYMTLAVYYHKSNPKALPTEAVLDIHSTITGVIDQKIAAGEDADKLKKEQDKVDAFLNTLGNVLSCEFIEINLVSKFNEQPGDLNLAKKVFSYALKAKCSDQPYFTRAGETLFQAEPSYTLAKALADRYYTSQEFQKSLEYYEKALTQAETDDQKFDALMGKASVHNKQNNKPKARATANEALSIRPEAPTALTFIGNLYFTSFDECKGGESRVKDRAVFIAAFEMYQRAGNQSQMEAARAQFPSIEEIFSENYQEGQPLNVDCWINKSVKIQRR